MDKKKKMIKLLLLYCIAMVLFILSDAVPMIWSMTCLIVALGIIIYNVGFALETDNNNNNVQDGISAKPI